MTVAIVLDTKRKTTTGDNAGRYAVKIRHTYTVDKKTFQKYYLTGVYATSDEFKRIIGNPGKSKEWQDKQTIVNEMFERAKAVIKENPYINPETFGDQLTARGSFKNPLDSLLSYAKEMEAAGRIGNAYYYKQAWSSFNKFSGGSLTFAQVTPSWLMRYEQWMLKEGKSITTVGMYAIAMRTIFNKAIRMKVVPSDFYPFEGVDCYKIPEKRGRKIALSEDNKNKILNYKTLNIERRYCADMWILSYFCNGMNFADIALLKNKHIQDGVILFERSKTSNTQRKKKDIVVVVRQEVDRIINEWRQKSDDLNEYVFPILRAGLTPKQIKERVRDFLQRVNAGMAEVCKEDLKIPVVTTYVARHTYATILKKKGVSLAEIREALGHASEATTEAYLDSFDIDTKKKIANLL